jgi:hypothetical protein
MPYKGQGIGFAEMFETLVSIGRRSDHEAANELASAFRDRAIIVAYRNGYVLEDIDLELVTECVRDYPNRGQLTAWRQGIIYRMLIDSGLGAMRLQFEQVCELVEPEIHQTASQDIMAREDAVRSCLEKGIIPASTVTWDVFCERVRDLADGWVDKKQGTLKRGFDRKTIERDVKKIIN